MYELVIARNNKNTIINPPRPNQKSAELRLLKSIHKLGLGLKILTLTKFRLNIIENSNSLTHPEPEFHLT